MYLWKSRLRQASRTAIELPRPPRKPEKWSVSAIRLLRDPFVVQAMQIVQSGAIGDVVGVDHFRSQFYTPYAGGPLPYQYRDGRISVPRPGRPFALPDRSVSRQDRRCHASTWSRSPATAVRSTKTGGCSCAANEAWARSISRGMCFPLQDVLVVHGTRGVMRVDIMGMSVTAPEEGTTPWTGGTDPQHRQRGTADDDPSDGQRLEGLAQKVLRYHGLQTIVAEFYEALRDGTYAAGDGRASPPDHSVDGADCPSSRPCKTKVCFQVRSERHGKDACDRRDRLHRQALAPTPACGKRSRAHSGAARSGRRLCCTTTASKSFSATWEIRKTSIGRSKGLLKCFT